MGSYRRVTAYQSDAGRVHKTKIGAAIDDLRELDDDEMTQSVAHLLVEKRRRIQEILSRIDVEDEGD